MWGIFLVFKRSLKKENLDKLTNKLMIKSLRQGSLTFFRPNTPWWMERCVVQDPIPCRDPFPLDTKPISLAKTTFYGYIIQCLIRNNRTFTVYLGLILKTISPFVVVLVYFSKWQPIIHNICLNVAIKVTGHVRVPQFYLLTIVT